MTIRGPFEPEFRDLPVKIPIFPLSGALLLPGGTLPLNIFEPRYLSMVRDAIASPLRLIGMIQPLGEAPKGVSHKRKLHHIGCAGKVISFNETKEISIAFFEILISCNEDWIKKSKLPNSPEISSHKDLQNLLKHKKRKLSKALLLGKV